MKLTLKEAAKLASKLLNSEEFDDGELTEEDQDIAYQLARFIIAVQKRRKAKSS